ncbi:MAG TPA: leucyl aminopeptidase [Acidothermaceae bacterium]|nr:leucyl aminopeptidase [Acidothermaceae bacterium]
MTAIALAADSPDHVKADAVVVGVTAGSDGRPVLTAGAQPINAAMRRRLVATLVSLGAAGEAGECYRIATLGATTAPVVVVVGLGAAPTRGRQFAPEVLRRATGVAVRSLAGSGKVAISLGTETDEALAAVAEGALLGAYSYRRYRNASLEGHPAPVASVVVLVSDPTSRAARQVVARAKIVCEAVCTTRDLVNTPPSDLHPKEFAEIAAAEAERVGIEIEVLDEKALKRGGYGGIIGVGQGSVNPPRLVRLAYRHPKATRTLALVGKGITFDSGGLSLKPAAPMEWMKSDMGGAAAVLTAMVAIARLKLPVNVTGWAPLAENMPSGAAQRPSDVLTIYGGKTVEVLNTDAEGRLVLADALARASEELPDFIVDAATLTGAQLVALGTRTSGVMANDDDFREAVVDASARAGEQMWPMPLPPELRKSLDSAVADIANMGESFGGMLVAAVFLSEFVGKRDGTPITWAHLDIAGPAFNQGDAYGYTPKGGTGAAVRTFVQLADDIAADRL